MLLPTPSLYWATIEMSGVTSNTLLGLDIGLIIPDVSVTSKKTVPRTACMALVTGLADTLQHCCKYAYHLCTIWFCPTPESPLVQLSVS